MDNPPKLDSLADYVLKRNRNPREDGQLRERLDVLEAWISEMRKLWRFSVLPGPDITITGGKVVGRSGNKILVFDGGGNQVAEFQASAAGLAEAVALASSGDLIQIPPCDFTYTGTITIASGVHLRGYYLSSMIRDITINVAAGGVVSDLQWMGSNAGGAATSITGTVYHCYIWGPSSANAVFMVGGDLIDSSVALGLSTGVGVGISASCYGKVINTHIYLAASLVASTALFISNGASTDYNIWIIGVTTTGCNSGLDCRGGGGAKAFIKDCLFTGTGYGGGFSQAGSPVVLDTHFKATGPGAITDLDVDPGSTPTFIGVTWGTIDLTGAFTYGESDRAKADHTHAFSDHALLTHLAYADAAHTGFAGLAVANSFTLINPLTTIAESWIGPSATTGIYFKDGNVGIGTTAPTHKLEVDGDLAFVGAQSILTTADSLTLAPAADLDLTPGGTARVRATSGVRLQSDNYVSQTTGWGISYLGSGDFRYLYADEMHVKAFIADLEQALAGGQIISKSVAPLAANFTVPAAEASAPLVVESFKGFDTFRVFVDGDMIRLRQFERGQTTTNLITNPSFEVNLAGWSGDGSRIATGGKFGTAYLDANTVTYTFATIVNATAYTFSFYCKGPYMLNLDPGNGAYYSVVGTADVGPDGWGRVTHTFTSLGTAFVVYLYNNNDYDAIQLELGAAATSYCDGSLGSGYHWTGTAHASTSYRGGVLDISNCWGTVVWVSTDTAAKTQTYTFTRSAAPNAGAVITGTVIGAGVLALDYGTTGNGYLESNAMDGAQAEYAPYHQIVSWATHPNSGLTVRTRLGNLKGIFNTANEYGLYAGAGITDADQYLRISNTAVEAHNLPIKMYDGASVTMQLSPTAPSFAMGSTLPSAYGTGDGLWMGKDTVYKFRVGDVDGEMLAWDGSYLYLKADASNYLKATGTSLEFYANTVLMLNIANTPAITIGNVATENVYITSTGVQIRDATTVYADLTAGTLILGEMALSKSYVSISAGAISMVTRNDMGMDTERIGLTAAGLLVIKDGYGDPVFTFDVGVGAEFTLPLTLGLGGGIYQGTGTFASPTTGLKIWNDSGIGRIAGYTSSIIQWYANTDGKLYAGGGAVSWSEDGFRLDGLMSGSGTQASIEWVDYGTHYSHLLIGTYSSGLTITGEYIWGKDDFTIGVLDAGHNLDLVTASDAAVRTYFGMDIGVSDPSDLRVSGGLYVGSLVTDPAAGTVYIKLSDADTNTHPYLLTLNHATSGTPEAGFGSAIIFRGETSGAGAAEDVPQSQMMSQWVVANHATRTGKWTLQVVDTAARTVMVGETSGTAPLVGFLGHAAVARAAHIANPTGGTPDAEARTAINAILVVIENLGFTATS